jgi:hypothetical protein
MAKTIGAFHDAALSHPKRSTRSAPSITALVRGAAHFLRSRKDRDVERFILQRGGGNMSDAIERELTRHFGRM